MKKLFSCDKKEVVMIDIPLNKALVPMERRGTHCCNIDCDLYRLVKNCHCCLTCDDTQRKDGKNVIFRLVDWPGTEEKCLQK